jgi:hypothetical protein
MSDTLSFLALYVLCRSEESGEIETNDRTTTNPIKVLLAIEPLMYREALAFYLRKHRPQAEVILASGETLKAEVERTKPLLIIANEPPATTKEAETFWVALRINEQRIDADISVDGYSALVYDVTAQDLLAAVDRAVEELVDGA